MRNFSIEVIKEFIENNLVYALLITYIVSVATSFSLIMFRNIKIGGPLEETEQVLHVGEDEPKQEQQLIVEIAGAVNSPGVYELEEGARVADLVREAGGFNEQALETWTIRFLNLAVHLKDTQKVYVPFKWDEESLLNEKEPEVTALVNDLISTEEKSRDETSSSTEDTTDKVNINISSSEGLESLPGIGPVYAGKIVQNRPYDNFQELQQKSGLSESALTKIKDLISY